MARCDNVLRSLATKFNVATDIIFLSNMEDKVWQDVVKYDNILRRLETKFKAIIEINFLSNMGAKVW